MWIIISGLGFFLAPSSPETECLNKLGFSVLSLQFFHILWESSSKDEAADTFKGFQPPACHSLSMVGERLSMGIQEGWCSADATWMHLWSLR